VAAHPSLLDGSVVDVLSVLVSVVYAIWRRNKLDPSRPLISKRTGADVLSGTCVFPLILLSMAVLSSWTVELLLSANRVLLTSAGIFALLAVLEE
jgi:hypothetical protein